MKRFDIDRTISAKTVEEAAKKFAKVLALKGYGWAGDEMVESVASNYLCCSNATLHNLKAGVVTSPETHDWTYYWAIDALDENHWYAWFICKE